MWVFSQEGFFSIVEDKKDRGVLQVRARHQRDLENLNARYGLKATIIKTPPPPDYGFRIVLPRADGVALVARLVGDIDYTNFKDRVHARRDQDNKNGAYMDIWARMRRTVQGTARRLGQMRLTGLDNYGWGDYGPDDPPGDECWDCGCKPCMCDDGYDPDADWDTEQDTAPVVVEDLTSLSGTVDGQPRRLYVAEKALDRAFLAHEALRREPVGRH